MLKHDFSHLMSDSANDGVLSAVYLAVGVLDTFPFFLATQKDSPITLRPSCWASFCPLHSKWKSPSQSESAIQLPKSWFVWPACAH